MKNKFIPLLQWINENDSLINNSEEPKYGCIMLDSKIDDWEENHLGGIDEKDIYVKPYDESYGLEEQPHCTILYGIHEDEVDPEVITNVIESNLYPIEVPITNIDIFEQDDYDVVKYNIDVNEDLQKFRDIFEKNFPNTQTFPDFKPHMTIAYVKPGTGKKYKRRLQKPFNVIFDKAVYSWHGDEEDPEATTRKIINLDKDEPEELSESIKGGKGDKLKPSDVCSKQLAIGKLVEKEHSSNKKTETEIALDHLAENPKYYSYLVEKGMVDEEDAINMYIKHFGKKKLPSKYKKNIVKDEIKID